MEDQNQGSSLGKQGGDSTLGVCVNDSLITQELSTRPHREPDYAAENRALSQLAEEMRECPEKVLQKVTQLAVELYRGDSAGIGILEADSEHSTCRWHAAADAFAPNLNRTMAWDKSRWGTAMDRDKVLLLSCAEPVVPALQDVSDRIHLGGPPALLAPQSAVGLALVLHELGTNARKYGAPSVLTGRLGISWNVRKDERALHMEWVETGGPAVQTPGKRGFGTTLIEKSLRRVGGTTDLRFAPDGISCGIQIPLAQ